MLYVKKIEITSIICNPPFFTFRNIMRQDSLMCTIYMFINIRNVLSILVEFFKWYLLFSLDFVEFIGYCSPSIWHGIIWSSEINWTSLGVGYLQKLCFLFWKNYIDARPCSSPCSIFPLRRQKNTAQYFKFLQTSTHIWFISVIDSSAFTVEFVLSKITW